MRSSLLLLLLAGPLWATDPRGLGGWTLGPPCALLVAQECRTASCAPGDNAPASCRWSRFTCDFRVCWDDPRLRAGGDDSFYRAVVDPASYAPGDARMMVGGVNLVGTVCLSAGATRDLGPTHGGPVSVPDLYLERGRFVLDLPTLLRGAGLRRALRSAQACAASVVAEEASRVSERIRAMEAQSPGHPLSGRDINRVESQVSRIERNRASADILRVECAGSTGRLVRAPDLDEARALFMREFCAPTPAGAAFPPECECFPRTAVLRRAIEARSGALAREGAGGGKAPPGGPTAGAPPPTDFSRRVDEIRGLADDQLEALLESRRDSHGRPLVEVDGNRLTVDGVAPFSRETLPEEQQEVLSQLTDEERVGVKEMWSRQSERALEEAQQRSPAPPGRHYEFDAESGQAVLEDDPPMQPLPDKHPSGI